MPFIKVNNKTLFYTLDSPTKPTQTLPTTLFIHGLGSSSCFYKTITPLLSFVTKCISLDTPNSGLSSHGLGKQTLATVVEDVVGLLDALDVKEKIVVVGHSMGGTVASTFAALHPEWVKGVVLLGPVDASRVLSESSEKRNEVIEAFEKRIEVVRNEGLEALANTVPIASTGSKAGPLQYAFIRALILGTSPEGYMCLCDCIANAKSPDYGAIKVPLLILVGGEDMTAPLPGCKDILNAYGTGVGEKKLEVLEGVGHWHCVEAPEVVAGYIVKFVKGLEHF